MRLVPLFPNDILIKEITAEDIFSVLSPTDLTFHNFEYDGVVHSVNVGNPKYRLFRRQPECVCCGVRWSRIFITPEIANGCVNWDNRTVNFFAEVGDNLVQLTRDHIVPRSQGGTEDDSNLQTMCWTCNVFKQDSNMSPQTMRGVAKYGKHIERQATLTDAIVAKLAEKTRLRDKAEKTAINIANNLVRVTNPDLRKQLEQKIKDNQHVFHTLKAEIEAEFIRLQKQGYVD